MDAQAETAMHGTWKKGPGTELFASAGTGAHQTEAMWLPYNVSKPQQAIWRQHLKRARRRRHISAATEAARELPVQF